MDQFIGEIRAFGFTFPTVGWALCNGQLIPISQNTVLFSLLGTYYGGDGRTTFALPNLQGATPVSTGQGPGLSLYFIGEEGGEASVTLWQSEMPQHSHPLQVSTRGANERQPGGFLPAVGSGVGLYNTVQQPTTALDPTNAVAVAGSGGPHNNMMPYLTVSFCIALQGIYPSRGGPEGVQFAVRSAGADIEVVDPQAPPPQTAVVFGPTEAEPAEGDG